MQKEEGLKDLKIGGNQEERSGSNGGGGMALTMQVVVRWLKRWMDGGWMDIAMYLLIKVILKPSVFSSLVFIYCIGFAFLNFFPWIYLSLHLCFIIWQIRLLTESDININYTMILKILYHGETDGYFKWLKILLFYMKKHLNIFSYKCYFNCYIISAVGF